MAQRRSVYKHILPELYVIWKGMRNRCNNSRGENFANYGGRGIRVCREWDLYGRFFWDMSPTFRLGLTLERIDNNGPYSKENCRWATREEQNSNKRNTIRLAFRGRTQSATQWARELGVKPDTIIKRIRRDGMSAEQALTTEL